MAPGVVTVPRTVLTLAAIGTMVRGDVLEGLCLLGAIAVWGARRPDPYGDDD